MEFIQKYARVNDEDSNVDSNDEVMLQVDEVTQSDQQFIDDTNNFQDQEPSNYRLLNVTRDLQEAINDHLMYGDNECSDPENFVPDCVEEIEYEFDNFNNFEKRIQIFEKDPDDSFFNAIFYSIYYTLLNNKDEFEFCQDNDKCLQVFGKNILNKLTLLKPELRLNLCFGTFESQCHIINDLLMENNLFLRVYEPRKKFRYLIKKLPKSKNSV